MLRQWKLKLHMKVLTIPDVRLVSPTSLTLQRHGKQCHDVTRCSECAWLKNGKLWRRRFPWLRAGYVGEKKELRLGCNVCSLEAANFAKAGGDTSTLSAYARFAVEPDVSWKRWRFKRHSNSRYHQACVQGKFEKTLHAPSTDEFQTLLHAMSRGQSEREQGQGTPSRRAKIMRYCVSESILTTYRGFLATATSITMMRDEPRLNLAQLLSPSGVFFLLLTPAPSHVEKSFRKELGDCYCAFAP